MPRKGEQPIPGYRLERFLGRGGFGEVWCAQAPGGTYVALKFVGLEGKAGVKEFRAIQCVKEIRHANLLPIHAFWMLNEEGDVLSDEMLISPDSIATMRLSANRPVQLVAAFLLGDQNLEEKLRECQASGIRGIPPAELIPLMGDAARGIDFLNSPRHDLGDGPVAIQHCDIKPQNIMVVGDSAMICDFGLAKALGNDQSISGVAGSPAYMAPECINGQPPTDTTDQYALAITYYHLRTGAMPFVDLTFPGMLNAHVRGDLDFSRMEEAEQAIVRRATSLAPAERYSNCRELVDALRVAVSNLSVASSRPMGQGLKSSVADVLSTVMPSTEPLDQINMAAPVEDKEVKSKETTKDIQSEIASKHDHRTEPPTRKRRIISSLLSLIAPPLTVLAPVPVLLMTLAHGIAFLQPDRDEVWVAVCVSGFVGDVIGFWAVTNLYRERWLQALDKYAFFIVAAGISIFYIYSRF